MVKPNKLIGLLVALSAMLPILTTKAIAADLNEGLIFQAPFDDSFDSTLTNPNRAPSDKKGDFPFVEGKSGKALRVGSGDSYLQYRADGNVKAEEGTVSVWVRPQWGADSDNFHMLWSLMTNGRFILYRHGGAKSLMFLFVGHDVPAEQYTALEAPIADWKPNEWHHVAATWSAGQVQIFVDGELKRELSNPNLVLPSLDKTSTFFIGDHHGTGFGTQSGLSNTPDTDLDDFRIYDHALTAPEIRTLAGKENTNIAPPALAKVIVPKTSNPPTIDGEFSFDEWKDAAGFSGFIDLDTGNLTDRQSGVLLTYDDKNLYAAMFAPVPAGADLKNTVDKRDGNVYGDDSVEIYLDPTNQRQKDKLFQFIGNPGGFVMDVKNGDPAWNADWQYKSKIQGNWRGFGQTYWVIEASIPFAQLGRQTPTDGEQWAANFARSWYVLKQSLTSWAATGVAYYNVPERFNTLEFREKAPAFQWINLTELFSGQPAFEGYMRGSDPAQLQLATTINKRQLDNIEIKSDAARPQFWTKTVDISGAANDRLQVQAKVGDTVLYSAEIPFAVETQPLRVFLRPIPSQERLIVDIDPLRFRNKWAKGWSLDVRLNGEKGKLAEKQVTEYAPPYARTEFSLHDVPAGNNRIEVEIKDAANKVVAGQNVAFVKPPTPEWLHNKIGITDRVPKPWTPIQASDTDFKVWGRNYRFGNDGLPQQIVSAGQNLLQSPLRLTIDGKAAPAPGKPKFLEKTGARIVRSSDANAGNWQVNWKVTGEYDGMLWYEVTLTPRGGKQTLQSLSLEMPMAPNASTLYNASNGSYGLGGGEAGATPEHWAVSWKQVFWLGNEKAGLSWFAESDQNWNLKNPKDAIAIDRGTQNTLARVNFVTQPFEVNKPITYRFGLHATPVRPLPKGWRGWVWAATNEYLTPNTTGAREKPTHATSWWMFWSPYISSPLDTKPGAKELVEANHKAGVKVIPYNALLALNEKAPGFEYFKNEWMHQPQMNAGGEAGQQTWFVSVKGSFQDYFLWALRERIRSEHWDGLYFDFDQGAVPDTNEFHGSGYVDDKGVRHPTFDILSQRRFHQRLWTMLQDETGNDEPIVMGHNSACMVPPIHAFLNVYYDGEQFNYTPKVNDDYTAVVPRAMWRSEFLGENFGGVPMFLPALGPLMTDVQRATNPAAKEAALKHLHFGMDTAMLYPLTHGTVFNAAWWDLDYIQPFRDAQRTFDIGNARFLGYWENAGQVTLAPANPDVVASLYAHDDRLWLVAGNWTAQEQKTTAKLDLSAISPRLNAATAMAKSVWKDGPLTRDGNSWTFTVPPKAARIIEIGPAGAPEAGGLKAGG